LLPLLEAKGLSADGMYRLELWCFFRAIEKFGTTPQHENLLIALEGKLLSIIDYMSTAEGYEEQLRRELNVSLGQDICSTFTYQCPLYMLIVIVQCVVAAPTQTLEMLCFKC